MKKKYLFLLILFGIFFSGPHSLFAKQDYIFRTFSPEGGFYYDGVKDVLQDKEGFMWILMDENLYRFDGYEFKSYYSYFVNYDRTVRSTLNNLTINNEGHLYVDTSSGLFQYDRKKNTFDLISNQKIDYIKVDYHDNMWIYTNRNWSILDLKTQDIFTPAFEGDSVTTLRPFFSQYEKESYVLTTSSQVFRYNQMKQEFIFCFQLPQDHYVHDMHISKGKLWVLSDKHGLLKVNLATSFVEDYFIIPDDVVKKCFHIDKNGLIWLGTMNGLYIINPETKDYTHHVNSGTNNFSLPNNSVWTIKEDNQKNIWIGTFSGGLAYVNLDENMPFKSYFPQRRGLGYAPVSGFAEDSEYIWIATEGGGLNRMNKQSEEFTYFTHDPHNNSLSSNNAKSLALDKYKRLWISTFTGGMDCLDTKNLEFKNYNTSSPDSTKRLLSNSLRKITLEADSGLWIVYQQHRQVLSYYSFDKDTFTHYGFGQPDNQYYIFDIVRGRNNKLWVLSYQMLYVMDLKDYSIREVPLKESHYLYGRTLCQDDIGNIWIGTTGNGLIKYNPETNEHNSDYEIHKRGIYTIYSISFDETGHLWLGTDNGLVCYSIADNNFQIFEREDGGQGEDYYPLASLKSADGTLYYGGTNGFTIIDTEQINRNTYRPKTIISDFLIDNNPLPLNPDQEIILNYNQANFEIKFASDNYLIPEKTYYKYKLHGYDERWIETNASNRMANYSKVPAGNYRFEIIASNNDGVWSEYPTLLNIQRKPAPWLSLWAKILYAVLFIFTVGFILHYYSKQKKLKLQLYLDELEKNKREELHQSQLRFFTNISHDFRTPLTLILGVLGKLKQEGVKDYYFNILNNNARRLLKLVNELMEFRKIENGMMNLNVESTDVNRLVENVAQDFKEFAIQKNISFQIECDKLLPSDILIDRQISEKIVMNLLNNAFKYTQENGSISLQTYHNQSDFQSVYSRNFMVKNTTEYNEYFLIVVHDTGIGISRESIESVFERFYKVNTMNADSHLGTGIGLALVRSLVLLHKGKIAIYSEKGKGTDMVVYLPLDPSVYEQEELLETQKEISREKPERPVSEEIDKSPFRNKKRILVVEDNHELRELIVDFLSDYYELVEAENGIEATELLTKMEIDMIISDIMMAGKDGITFCKEVKNNLETSHIPVILLTAKVGMDNKIQGVEAGADSYFEKPIDFNFLLVSINNIFDHQTKLKEYYSKNYFVDSPELTANEQDNKFLQKVIDIIEKHIDQPKLDVNYIATELTMSRSKLYLKIKALTDKSIIEFILNYKLRKAARIMVEEDVSMREVMERIGIESQSYFTYAFKKEFGETPKAFAAKRRFK